MTISAAEIEAIRNSKIIAVVAKPNSSRNEIVGYSDEKKAWLVNVKAAAEKDKANKELLSFLKITTGKRFSIKRGARSRKKILILVP